jgi:signal transduction histidine kinase
MRFNDLLRTVLANMGEGTSATVTRWRQCIDLLAQYDVSGADSANALDAEQRDIVLGMVAEMRTQISVDQRIASVAELGSRLRSPGLVRLLSQDHPTLVSTMMARVRLTDPDWAAIIPDLGPLARSVLRRRDDLDSLAKATLRQFGSIDLALPSLVTQDMLDALELTQVAADATRETTETSQIGRIVEQIERYKETRTLRPDAPALPVEDDLPELEPVQREPAYAPPPVSEFAFETDAVGTMRFVSGAPRAAAAGLSIGMPALDSRHGADGMALGAFRRRAAFEHARFTISDGPLEGEWRIAADPRFDRASGRFLGYAGSARREFAHEGMVRANPAAQGSGWAGLSAASTRQLIHELRTPLNAIQGYAEMIEAQLMGPVTDEYRDMARRILSDAHSLTSTFDDLDMASRIEHGDHRTAAESVDLTGILRSVVTSFDPDGPSRIDIEAEADLPLIGGDRSQIERMLSHLVRAGYAALGEGERLTLRIAADPVGASVGLVMLRPKALRDIADRDLLDHGYLVDQKLRDAPPLGLAFTLKLVRGIASHLGGAFDIAPEVFGVILPAAAAFDGDQENLR